MTHTRISLTCLTALLAVALVGCQQPSMEDMMTPPTRPAELDRLGMFIGTWEGTSEMTAPGSDEIINCTGRSTARWAADGWVMIEEYEGALADDQYEGVALWTWDPKAKKFRTFWTSSFGELAHGTATFDEETKTWHMRGESRNLYKGSKTIGEGTATMVDDNTMEWSFTEYGPMKLKKLAEGKGTSRRK